MYELGHVLLLFWGGQVGVVGSQGVKDRPAIAAQFLAILRTIFPKLAVPLLLRPHPCLEVHASPAGPPSGGVIDDPRVRGRRLG